MHYLLTNFKDYFFN